MKDPREYLPMAVGLMAAMIGVGICPFCTAIKIIGLAAIGVGATMIINDLYVG